MAEPEVIYAVRRADGDLIAGDYSFMVALNERDWDAAENDAENADEAIEYELVRFDVTVIGTRKLPECSQCAEPATLWGLCEKHAREDDPDYFDVEVRVVEG